MKMLTDKLQKRHNKRKELYYFEIYKSNLF